MISLFNFIPKRKNKISLIKITSLPNIHFRFFPGNLKPGHAKELLDIIKKNESLLSNAAQVSSVNTNHSLVRYNPQITKDIFVHWRSHDPLLASRLHARSILDKKVSPVKMIGDANVNPITTKVIEYISTINPRNEVLNDFYLDKQLSYRVTCEEDYFRNLLHKFEQNEIISFSEIEYVIELFQKQKDISFSNTHERLLDVIEVIKTRMITERGEVQLESRDDYEYRQLYYNQPENTQRSLIQESFSEKRNPRPITLEDFTKEIERLNTLYNILLQLNNEITEKEILEIMRRENLVVYNTASTANEINYPESQTAKLYKEAYNHKEIILGEKISKEMLQYIEDCLEKAAYTVQVEIAAPQKAVLLDGISLHPCLLVKHPTDSDKRIVVLFTTSANEVNTVLIDKIQKDFPISETTDRSKIPPLAEKNISFKSDDALSHRQTKGQLIRFLKNIVIVSKEDFLENTLATEYMTKGLNTDNESIHSKLLESFRKFRNSLSGKDQFVEQRQIFDRETLIKITATSLKAKMNDFEEKRNEMEDHINSLKPEKKEARLKELGLMRRNYWIKQKTLALELAMSAQYPVLKPIINISRALEERKRMFREKQLKQKTKRTGEQQNLPKTQGDEKYKKKELMYEQENKKLPDSTLPTITGSANRTNDL